MVILFSVAHSTCARLCPERKLDTPGFVVQGALRKELRCPDPGGLKIVSCSLRAASLRGSGSAPFSVEHGDFVFSRTLDLRSAMPRKEARHSGFRGARRAQEGVALPGPWWTRNSLLQSARRFSAWVRLGAVFRGAW